MKKYINPYVIVFLILGFMTACGGAQSAHVFKGKISGAENLQAALELSYFDRTTKNIGNTSIDGSGNFAIEHPEAFEKGIYTLTIGAKKMFFMLDGSENTVEVTGDLNTMDRLEVNFTGSESASCYASVVQELYKARFTSAAEVNAFLDKNTCNPLLKAFFTSQLLGRDAASFVDNFVAASKGLETYMPGSKYATDFTNMVDGVQKATLQQQAAEKIKVGEMAPDILLPGPDGKERSLSSLKGKVVLLDFWASWCGPCRRANPHVVEIYNKYNAKGFDVFSVSLDNPNGKDKWLDAIAKDGLLWDNHVSDLKGWKSAPAAMYGVSSIPRTFLIGRDGKIVAVNPRDNLEAELLKVL
ncbi:MAG: TlpA disulfide reductase family protein [Saprospiraceae bacterium]